MKIIPVTSDGLVDLDWLAVSLKDDDRSSLISVMMVNNETGIVQPIKQIVDLARAHGNAQTHTDAVQAAGRLDIDMDALGVDYLSLSAHKCGGPMGAGALVYNHDKIRMLKPILKGGGQERSRRSGTENASAIAGFGLAAALAMQDLAVFEKINAWREEAEGKMLDAVPKAIIFGQNAPRVANTIQISLPDIRAETQLMALDLEGIAVSSGSACSSGSIKPSHVLLAMGASEGEATGALRISMGWNTKREELDRFVDVWIKMARGHGF